MKVAKKHYAWLIVAAVLVIGGGFLLYKYFQKPKAVTAPDRVLKPIVPTSTALTTSFPMKQGSRGNMVKQLQTYLGVTADGIWGPITQAALVAQTGKTQITSQDELTAVLNNLSNNRLISNPQTKADQLYNAWNNSSSPLQVSADSIAYEVSEDLDGNLTLTGKQITIPANQTLSRNSYIVTGSTTSGYLELEITDGTTARLYKVDPANMSLAGDGTTSNNYLSTLLNALS